MQRKLDYDETTQIGSLTKKIKTSNIIMDQTKLNNNNNNNNTSISLNTKQSLHTFVMNTDKHSKNNALKLAILSQLPTQSSSSVFPSRKRRYRKSQEVYNVNTLIPCSTTQSNGEIRKKSDLSCVVCRAVAHGYNFDAISCESCKAFFRRNALFNTDRLKCRRDGTCEITHETRRRCKSCRLKKCFAVGMRKEWILTEEEKLHKKHRIEENRRLRASNTNYHISSKDSMRTHDLNLQNDFLDKIEKSSLKSKSYDQCNNIINNVVIAYHDRIKLDLTGYGWSYPLARKITGLYQIINAKNTTALHLISFYKSLHDFDILSESDKINLIKNNLRYIFFFNASLKYDPVHDVYHDENTNDKPLYGVHICEAYGIDHYVRCTKIIRALHSIVQIDKRIMQVALVIFLFSKGLSITTNSNEPSINNYKQIFHIQNKYAKHLWLFIEKTYGYIRAVHIFSTLISKCLLIQELICDTQHEVYEELDRYQVSSYLQSIIQTA
ncbi:unnamed protein product [Rotaria sordida]|uniref:Nuclear receptor domain-containing protein n=1 Tax=Rotaria sordida TaxID=392033 RepID=A0A818UKV3_9BILA|nr:unnamed protein product [Rotaria sordida]CAF1001661.1 unnamed protein product [Rotaria sordida]CAF1086440.1 unnamed protein product [Rotaria sordida]CAF3698571.1 unnamed protein product [Rotaria sordida]